MARINFQLPDELHERATQAAKALGISFAELVRQSTKMYLDANEDPRESDEGNVLKTWKTCPSESSSQ